MKIFSNNDLDLQCGNIVEHYPGPEHISFGVGTLIKKTGDELWIVKFFDGREFEMVSWGLKKIRRPLTAEYYSCRVEE
jgi:hypothetical protein